MARIIDPNDLWLRFRNPRRRGFWTPGIRLWCHINFNIIVCGGRRVYVRL